MVAEDCPRELQVTRLKLEIYDAKDTDELDEKMYKTIIEKDGILHEWDEDNHYPMAFGNCVIDGVEYDVSIEHALAYVGGPPRPTSGELPAYAVFVTNSGGDLSCPEFPDLDDGDRIELCAALEEAISLHPVTDQVIAELDEKARHIRLVFELCTADEDVEDPKEEDAVSDRW